MRKDVLQSRRAIPPHKYTSQFAYPNPDVINDVNRLGVMPSSDTLLQALSTQPAAYSVTANTPASTTISPLTNDYQQFRNTFEASQAIGLK